MTSALREREGGWSKRDDSTERLREWDSDKGGRGSKNLKILRMSFKYHHLGDSLNCARHDQGGCMQQRGQDRVGRIVLRP